MRGTTVCVLFAKSQDRFGGSAPACGAPQGVKRRCRPHVLFFPPCRLTAQDPGLSSRGMRVRLPSGRPFSRGSAGPCSEAGFRFALSDPNEASRRPKARQGPSFPCVRGVRATCRSASPESGVRVSPSAPFGAVVFNSQHSGLLIRTVRVRIPPAPPFNPRSLRTDTGEVFRRRVTLAAVFVFNHDVPEQRRGRPAKPVSSRVQLPPSCPLWGSSANSSTPHLQCGGDGA